MKNLDYVIGLLCKLGLKRDEVLSILSRGDSAFNAFEGLKCVLMMAWEDEGLSGIASEEQRSAYKEIMGFRIGNVVRQSDVERHRRDSVVSATDDALRLVGPLARNRMINVMKTLRDRLEEEYEKDPTNQSIKVMLERLDSGKSPF